LAKARGSNGLLLGSSFQSNIEPREQGVPCIADKMNQILTPALQTACTNIFDPVLFTKGEEGLHGA